MIFKNSINQKNFQLTCEINWDRKENKCRKTLIDRYFPFFHSLENNEDVSFLGSIFQFNLRKEKD